MYCILGNSQSTLFHLEYFTLIRQFLCQQNMARTARSSEGPTLNPAGAASCQRGAILVKVRTNERAIELNVWTVDLQFYHPPSLNKLASVRFLQDP